MKVHGWTEVGDATLEVKALQNAHEFCGDGWRQCGVVVCVVAEHSWILWWWLTTTWRYKHYKHYNLQHYNITSSWRYNSWHCKSCNPRHYKRCKLTLLQFTEAMLNSDGRRCWRNFCFLFLLNATPTSRIFKVEAFTREREREIEGRKKKPSNIHHSFIWFRSS